MVVAHRTGSHQAAGLLRAPPPLPAPPRSPCTESRTAAHASAAQEYPRRTRDNIRRRPHPAETTLDCSAREFPPSSEWARTRYLALSTYWICPFRNIRRRLKLPEIRSLDLVVQFLSGRISLKLTMPAGPLLI